MWVLVVFGGFLVLQCITDTHGMKVSINMQPIKGQSIVLQCEVVEIASVQIIRWFKDGEPLKQMPGKYDGVKSEGGRVDHLTIRNLTEDDDGAYTCEVIHQTGISESENMEISVRYGYTTKVTGSEEVKVKVNQTITLDCEILKEGRPKNFFQATVWYRNGKRLNEEGRQLVIERAQPLHSGDYSCEISNGINGISHSLTIYVLSSLAMKSYKVIDNNTKCEKFICSAKGYDIKELIWLRNGERLTETLRDYYSVTKELHTKSSLEICIPNQKDLPRGCENRVVPIDGTYKCMAIRKVSGKFFNKTSDAGTYQSQGKINKKINLLQGETLSFNCPICSTQLQSHVSWTCQTKRGERCPPSSHSSGITVMDSQTTDSGTYTCQLNGSNTQAVFMVTISEKNPVTSGTVAILVISGALLVMLGVILVFKKKKYLKKKISSRNSSHGSEKHVVGTASGFALLGNDSTHFYHGAGEHVGGTTPGRLEAY